MIWQYMPGPGAQGSSGGSAANARFDDDDAAGLRPEDRHDDFATTDWASLRLDEGGLAATVASRPGVEAETRRTLNQTSS